jgi:hypothetical protein
MTNLSSGVDGVRTWASGVPSAVPLLETPIRARAPVRGAAGIGTVECGVAAEADLYPPVKTFLEGLGYVVKGEVGGCDVVATRGDEPPVIVELKRAFNLALLLQGVDRLSLTDRVYLAVHRPTGRRRRSRVSGYRSDVRQLCRRLGLGLLVVAPDRRRGAVEVIQDPVPYTPRKRVARLGRLLGEHARRIGDPTPGGVSRTPIVTAYRQEALRCAMLIERSGQARLKALRETGLVPNASRIVQRDVYGWFHRVARATYALTDRARQDLTRFAGSVDVGATGPTPPPASANGRTRPGGGPRSNGRSPVGLSAPGNAVVVAGAGAAREVR